MCSPHQSVLCILPDKLQSAACSHSACGLHFLPGCLQPQNAAVTPLCFLGLVRGIILEERVLIDCVLRYLVEGERCVHSVRVAAHGRMINGEVGQR